MLLNTSLSDYLYHFMAISFLLIGLYVFSILSVLASDGVYLALTAILWLAIALLGFNRARVRRRLFLLRHLKHNAVLKPWLVGGPLLFSLKALIALPLSVSLSIVLSQGIGAAGWLQLVLFCYGWPLLYHAVSRGLSHEFKPASQEYFALSLSVILGALYWFFMFISAGFFSQWPDLSTLSFSQAFYYGKTTAIGESGLLRALAGVWLGVDSARLWLTQYLAAAGFSYLTNILIWFISLLQAALFILPILCLLQGTTILSNKYSKVFSTLRWRKSAIAAIAFIPALLLWDQFAQAPWQWLTGKRHIVQIEGVSYSIKPEAWDRVLDQELQKLDWQRRQLFQQLTTEVERDIDQLFAPALRQIPVYADWHYSLTGVGSRALSGFLNHDLHQQMMTKLFVEESFEVQADRINYLLLRRFSLAQQQLADQLVEQLIVSLAPYKMHPHQQGLHHAHSLDIKQLYQDTLQEQLAGIDATAQLAKAAIGGALATVTWAVGRHALMRSVGYQAGRAAPLVCVVTGPVAIACGAMVFSLSTVLIETALLAADEYQNRAQLEQQLAHQLLAMREDLKRQYQQQLLQMLGGDLSKLQDKVQATMRPLH